MFNRRHAGGKGGARWNPPRCQSGRASWGDASAGLGLPAAADGVARRDPVLAAEPPVCGGVVIGDVISALVQGPWLIVDRGLSRRQRD